MIAPVPGTEKAIDRDGQRALVYAEVKREQEKRRGYKMRGYFPDTGPYRRELYVKHMEFVRLGAIYRERALMAANRIGKSDLGAYEVTCHLTGEYPAWWDGRRFSGPIEAWAAGDTSATVRDILQLALLGEQGRYGTGMIPAHAIKHVTHKQGGVPGSVDTIWVHHVSGGHSTVRFKSYDQKRESFQGTAKQIVWLDEEPPMDIYTECLLRTMTTDGIIIATFTPLKGVTPVVLEFMQAGETKDDDGSRSKVMIQATWADAPHLSEAVKAELFASLPVHEQESRSKGIPSLGEGAVYTVPVQDITVQPFPLPKHYLRVYGLDVGWRWTAAVWGAWDRENDTLYITDTYKRGQAEPAIHAAAIKARGEWIPGVCDPAAASSNQVDGRKLLDVYRALGLNLQPADHAVESGIFEVWGRLASGRMKVFASCSEFFGEYSLYRRGKDGKVVKEHDHCLIAGTQVWTETGWRAIETIQAGERVMTRQGLRTVLAAGQTALLANVYRLINTEGNTIIGTAAHPIWTANRGWIPLDAVRYGDILTTCQGAPQSVSSQSLSTASSSGATRTHLAARIASTTRRIVSIGTLAWADSTRRFTRRTTARFLQAITSIIETTTQGTTLPTTCRLSLAGSISLTTTAVYRRQRSAPIWTCSDPRRARGIGRRLAESGIVSRLRGLASALSRRASLDPARSVGSHSMPSFRASERTASARTTARARGVVGQASTTRPASAHAVSPSFVTSTSRPATAHAFALAVVAEPERQPVYNLTVVEVPEYFANGVLVHNCMDATRYLAMSGLRLAIVEPPKVVPDEFPEATLAGSARDYAQGWMA